MSGAKVGAVLVFRDGVTLQEATAALVGLRQVLEPLKLAGPMGTPLADRNVLVREYDPQFGEPVWYIP